jgi:hypothetical protein
MWVPPQEMIVCSLETGRSIESGLSPVAVSPHVALLFPTHDQKHLLGGMGMHVFVLILADRYLSWQTHFPLAFPAS